jgi:hypothetical protein
MGVRFGWIGLYCSAFLFLPVARGSVLLRFIDIPFEHAIRYHIWLGHLTLLLFTIHGLLFVIAWAIEGDLLQEVSANAEILCCGRSLHIYNLEERKGMQRPIIERWELGMRNPSPFETFSMS